MFSLSRPRPAPQPPTAPGRPAWPCRRLPWAWSLASRVGTGALSEPGRGTEWAQGVVPRSAHSGPRRRFLRGCPPRASPSCALLVPRRRRRGSMQRCPFMLAPRRRSRSGFKSRRDRRDTGRIARPVRVSRRITRAGSPGPPPAAPVLARPAPPVLARLTRVKPVLARLTRVKPVLARLTRVKPVLARLTRIKARRYSEERFYGASIASLAMEYRQLAAGQSQGLTSRSQLCTALPAPTLFAPAFAACPPPRQPRASQPHAPKLCT